MANGEWRMGSSYIKMPYHPPWIVACGLWLVASAFLLEKQHCNIPKWIWIWIISYLNLSSELSIQV
jgi:hypothetical protein